MTDANSTTHSTPTPLAEFTLKAVVAGVLLGCLFGAANAYLGLRVGLTVSASIPCAVMTVAVFKLLRARGTILEANMSQTIGSASTSLASGSIFTIPALFMWGVVPPYTQIVVLCFLGGVLGLCAMIPLRRLLIVQEHETLPYPEGKACADVLKATAASSAGSGWIFGGILVGALVKLALAVFFLVPKDLAYEFELLPKARLAIELAPALLAIGFILGIRQSGVLLSGGIVSALVLTPLIAWFGAKIPVAVAPETKKTIAEMTSGEIFRSYVRYVGAGAVATAGILTVLKSLPSMWGAVSGVLAGLRKRASTAGDERTDRDLPSWVIVLGIATVIFVAGFAPGVFAGNLALGPRLVLAAGVGVFGLLFVTVAARIVGIVGVSSQPTSGIALVTLIAIASVFAAQGWTDAGSKAAVLTVGTIVAVAASKAGDISQDLKTGYLLGATPARQQLGQLIGASVACWAVAGTVYLIGTSSGFGEGSEFGAPQATMMKTIVEGVLEGALPWDLVLTGAGLSIGALLCGVSALAFAIGVYLPLASLTPIFLGGCARAWCDRKRVKTAGAGEEVNPGVLAASGIVAGEGLAGVAIAALVAARVIPKEQTALLGGVAGELGVGILLLAVAAFMAIAGRKR